MPRDPLPALKRLIARYRWTTEETAVCLGVHPNSLRNWLSKRAVPSRMAKQRIVALLEANNAL